MNDTPQATEHLPTVRIIGRAGSATAYKIRDYLQRSDVPFEWIELTNDQQARTLAGVDSLRDPRLPVCIFSDGTRMECPTLRQITEKLGWFRTPTLPEYDLADLWRRARRSECCRIWRFRRFEDRRDRTLGDRWASGHDLQY